jgi:hypothetical protein
MTKNYSIRFIKGYNGEYYSQISHKNGNMLFISSERYKRLSDCKTAAKNLFNGIINGWFHWNDELLDLNKELAKDVTEVIDVKRS